MLPYIPPPDYALRASRSHVASPESSAAATGAGDAESPRQPPPRNGLEEEERRRMTHNTQVRDDEEASRSERVRLMLWERGVHVLPTAPRLPPTKQTPRTPSGKTPTGVADDKHKEDDEDEDEDWCSSRWSYGITRPKKKSSTTYSSSASSSNASVSSPRPPTKAALRKHLENHRNFDTLRSYRSCANCDICRQIAVFDAEEVDEEVAEKSADLYGDRPATVITSGSGTPPRPVEDHDRGSEATLLAQTRRLRCDENVLLDRREEPLSKKLSSPPSRRKSVGVAPGAVDAHAGSVVLIAVVRARRHRRAKTPHELDVRRGHLFNVVDWCAESKWALCTERIASTLPPHSEFSVKPPSSSGVGFVRKKDVEVLGVDYLPQLAGH